MAVCLVAIHLALSSFGLLAILVELNVWFIIHCCCPRLNWSRHGGSNPALLLTKQVHCHCAMPAHLRIRTKDSSYV